MEKKAQTNSPRWGSITKLVVTMTFVVILGALLVRFNYVIGPVLLALILAYLLHPAASFLNRKTRLSWGLAVGLIYLVIILLLLALLTWGGFGLVTQVQNLITTVQTYIKELPAFINSLSTRVFILGPFKIDFSLIDWQTIGTQILSSIEPALGRVGGLVGSIAGSAFSTLGWTALLVILSYFFLLESGGLRSQIIQLDMPDYNKDIKRLSSKLGRIWNAFLRGQMIIFFSKVIIYTILLSILGVRYAFALALLAGFASFLPYIGPAITWIVMGLVTFFQASIPFGLTPLAYTIIVIVTALIIDQVYDNLVYPRIMADTLNVHPAFVLIAAIIAASLFGLLGIFIAAPLLATVQLIGRYTFNKLLDKDPWQQAEEKASPPSGWKWLRKLRAWWLKRRRKGKSTQSIGDQNEKSE